MRSSLPTSHGFQPDSDDVDDIHGLSSVKEESSGFAERFNWAATVDQTTYLCVPLAVKFRQEVCGGEERIRDYCFNLAHDGGHAVAMILGTEIMQHPESRLSECCFVNVRLPLQFHQSEDTDSKTQGMPNSDDGPRVVKWVMDRLLCEFDTWLPGKFYGGAAWMRFSAQIYLEMKVFEWIGNVLKALCERVGKGEWHGPLEKIV